MANHSNRMNTFDVIVIAFGAMIGWGWVVSSGEWIEKAGILGTAIGFILGGLMIYFVGLVYSELTTAMPESGGASVFCRRAFGSTGSFICTWIVILSYAGVVCFEACSLATVLQYLFPGFLKGYLYTIAGFDVYLTWLMAAILAALLITYINIRGLKTAAVMQTILTVTIAAVGLLLIAASAFTGDISNMEQQVFVGSSSESVIKNVLSVAVVTPFFLFGFDVIPQVAGEIHIPLKKLGRILVLSIVMAISFYAFVVLAIGYSMNAQEIAAECAGTGMAAAKAMEIAFGSKAMAKVLILGGVCGIVTSWNSFLIGGSRAVFALAQSRMLPAFFAKKHKKYDTPVSALLFIGGLSVVAPFMGRAMLTWIANAASFSCCITYFIVSVAFLVLRKKDAGMERPFKVKCGVAVGIAAMVTSGFMVLMYLLPNSGSTMTKAEWFIFGGWLALGLCMGLACRLYYKEKFGTAG